jgi:magnesium transporter
VERTVLRSAAGDLEWIDVTGPTRAELQELAARYGLHQMSVEDCLDPWHLPKYERFDSTTFVIVRSVDPEAGPIAASVQALTRKVAIFVRAGMVLTVHRKPMQTLSDVEHRFTAGGEEPTAVALLGAIVNGVLDSYGPLLDVAEDAIDEFEEGVFTDHRRPPPTVDLYLLKRRVTIMNRMIRQTGTVIQRLVPPSDRSEAAYQDLRENADSYHFFTEHLLDAINSLIGIHVALASQRTNEVMRVLTVFSAFFLPLTFLVGVYGMNFRHMPELEARWGYPLVLVAMAIVSAGIAWWFWRLGWFRTDPKSRVPQEGPDGA